MEAAERVTAIMELPKDMKLSSRWSGGWRCWLLGHKLRNNAMSYINGEIEIALFDCIRKGCPDGIMITKPTNLHAES